MTSKLLTLILFTGALLSCTVVLKDGEFCADEGVIGATCFHSLSTSTRELSKQEWDKERFGQICESTDVFENLKAAIESLCHNTRNCTYEQQAEVDQFFARIEKLKKRVKP